jgi:hypothetical protein
VPAPTFSRSWTDRRQNPARPLSFHRLTCGPDKICSHGSKINKATRLAYGVRLAEMICWSTTPIPWPCCSPWRCAIGPASTRSRGWICCLRIFSRSIGGSPCGGNACSARDTPVRLCLSCYGCSPEVESFFKIVFLAARLTGTLVRVVTAVC